MTRKERAIADLKLKFAAERGSDKTYCPSEVAKVLSPEDWRVHMDSVRRVADILVESGHLIALQGNRIIGEKPSQAKGPIRLREKS